MAEMILKDVSEMFGFSVVSVVKDKRGTHRPKKGDAVAIGDETFTILCVESSDGWFFLTVAGKVAKWSAGSSVAVEQKQ